jgi:hypothetical protein
MRDFIKRNKLIVITTSLVVVVLIVFAAYIAISRAGKEPVQIYLIPSDTKLLVNGEQLTEGTSYLKPGRYNVDASRSGFVDKKEILIVGSPNTSTIDIALNGSSDSAKKWQSDNEELYLEYEARGGIRAQQEGETFTADNPITSKLPLENPIYTIGYRADPADPTGNSIILEIDTMDGYRNAAINKIREIGFDPTNFKITFRDYESPFDYE